MTITTISYKLRPFCLCKSDPSIDSATMSNVATKVAVVGSGISGAVCASALAKNGISVTLFESARGPGGRMSQRSLFMNGSLKVLLQNGKRILDLLIASPRNFLTNDQEAPNKKYVGLPGMNSICKALCNETGVESKFGASIGSGVVLSDKSIASPRFTHVTGRPPPLDLSLTPELALKLQDIPVSPCFALMLAFAEPLSSISVKGFSFKNSEILRWSHCESSKPGRSTVSERWVLHSTANYASGVIAQTGLQKPSSATLTKVAEELFREFQSIGLNIPQPFFMKAHRWGSAFPTASIAREEKCLWDRKKRLAICGDFCVSPNVEGAILSGLAAASKLTEMLSCL
ncbi:hypothetical protein OIU84_024179 [Salix udensis]|uniref:Amine oxidase domain-containing protein n=1 Tax=Salix udensis TaxID=889485 RepID=A0AAD6PC92_9ROSI|nr:hypothetical protein OIU84_024179 [Salix udensis]